MWFLASMEFDGIVLWIALGMLGVLTLVAIENEKPWWFTILLGSTMALLEFETTIKTMTFAYNHPLFAAECVVAYFVIGTAWIALKWISHVHWIGGKFDKIKDKIQRDIISDYKGSSYYTGGVSARDRSEPVDGPYVNKDFTLNNAGLYKLYHTASVAIGLRRPLPLQVSEHKTELYLWWLGWPLSMFWTILNDPIKRLVNGVWNFVYNKIGRFLQEISNKRFKI
jgi:hypothetical protein